MRLVLYSRVSSESQVDGFGLIEQERSCRKWARQVGHRVVEVCRDEARSGTLDAAGRPGLSCVLEALANGVADGVVVARLDRIARQLAIQEATLAVVWRRGGHVFAADQGEILRDDPDDPVRTAMRLMVGVFAELDRMQIVKRLRDGRAAKAATGKHATGPYPFGYAGAGKGRERDAAPDPTEQVTVERIFALRRSGASYRGIAAALGSEGLRPRRAASWSPMSVRAVVVRAGLD